MNRLSVLAFIIVTLMTNAALACPVCGASKAPNDWAFGVTTLLLSCMPPLMFVGGAIFLVRAHRRAARRELDDANGAPSISTPD